MSDSDYDYYGEADDTYDEGEVRRSSRISQNRPPPRPRRKLRDDSLRLDVNDDLDEEDEEDEVDSDRKPHGRRGGNKRSAKRGRGKKSPKSTAKAKTTDRRKNQFPVKLKFHDRQAFNEVSSRAQTPEEAEGDEAEGYDDEEEVDDEEEEEIEEAESQLDDDEEMEDAGEEIEEIEEEIDDDIVEDEELDNDEITTPDPTHMTERQREKYLGEAVEPLLSLKDKGSKKKMTDDEMALRKLEQARKRKNFSIKKLEMEKRDTLNKLLMKRADKVRDLDKLKGKEYGDEEEAVQRRPVPDHPALFRWNSKTVNMGEGKNANVESYSVHATT